MYLLFSAKLSAWFSNGTYISDWREAQIVSREKAKDMVYRHKTKSGELVLIPVRLTDIQEMSS